MRKSILLTTVLALVTVAAAILSAQSALDQLKAYTDSAPRQSKAGAPPAAPEGTSPAAQSSDIIGIRLGMPLRDAYTILQTAHPTVKLGMYPINIPGIEKPVLEGFSFGFESFGRPERVIVDVTPPPNQQVVWKVRRYVSQQKIYRANVLSSLRAKYGKETATKPAVANDQQLTDMWWVLDEQGHPAKLPPPGTHFQTADLRVSECGQKLIYGADPGSSWFVPDNLELSLPGLDPSDWCTSSGIALHASVSAGDIVGTLNVEMFHVPLAVRSGTAEMAFVNEVVKRQRQQQIDQSKQAKPKL